MTEKYLYPNSLDIRTNDGVRAYCRAEGLDEKYFRRCAFPGSSVTNLLRALRRRLKRLWHRKGDPFISGAGLPG